MYLLIFSIVLLTEPKTHDDKDDLCLALPQKPLSTFVKWYLSLDSEDLPTVPLGIPFLGKSYSSAPMIHQ